MEIKNYFTGEVIFECEEEDFIKKIEENKYNLSGANLYRAILSETNLSEANLYRANLSGANLCRAILSETNLSEANLYRAILSEANLSGANLSETNLSGANLYRAILSGANLSGANLCRADLDHTYLHIKGSDYSVYCIGDQVQIGCEIHTFDEWDKIAGEIEKRENRTDEQIKEYRKYLDICRELNKK